MNDKDIVRIEKVLSSNDTGETGSHQAGILVPKIEEIMAFFPHLSQAIKNPRICLQFSDETDSHWVFNYIYYNNRRFGGTRNEYRLTGLTKYMRSRNLKAGDVLIFTLDGSGRRIAFRRERELVRAGTSALILGNTWKVINMKGEKK
jgi:hypothetical protein